MKSFKNQKIDTFYFFLFDWRRYLIFFFYLELIEEIERRGVNYKTWALSFDVYYYH